LNDRRKRNLALELQMAKDWSREEVEATVSDYFDMLTKELRAEPFNKADHNRNLQKLLDGRTKGAIERKHQNISAVLIELGYPYIDGYKPLANYQGILRRIVEDRLAGAVPLHQATAVAVETEVREAPHIDDVLSILVEPPSQEPESSLLYDKPQPIRAPVRRNYLEIESRNRSLGLAGEKLVIEFEQQRLWRAGKKDLASRIEHVSNSQGDHLGFDILSFELDGRDRLIEVKTTRFGAMTPFFASRNEVEISESRDDNYQLYRLFNFTRQPKMFTLGGSLRHTCRLDPIQYSATPRPTT
jgi:hypothetical protein